MPAIYHEGSWLGNATDPEVLVKDTVGWTGKNLLNHTQPTKTEAGVSWTYGSNGEVIANGTTGSAVSSFNEPVNLKAGKYIVSGCPANGSINTYCIRIAIGSASASALAWEYGNGVEITLSEDSIVYIQSQIRANQTVNNLTFYPMLRKADIIDPTYEPYHESVEEEINQIYAGNGVLGAKNLLENKATTQTIFGVTFTVNKDGSIVVNGTCNTGGQIGVYCQLYINIGMNLDTDKRYILSGCPINDIGATLQHSSWTSGGGFVQDNGNGVEYNGYDAQQYPNNRVMIFIPNGKTANNLVFKPMIRLASDPDDTYQPYAMTNRELTEKKINIADLKTVVSASSDFTDFKTRIASL